MAINSNKAAKESESLKKKAKDALKKNNQELAKIYLQASASKNAEAMNIKRLGMKMDFIADNIKTLQNN